MRIARFGVVALVEAAVPESPAEAFATEEVPAEEVTTEEVPAEEVTAEEFAAEEFAAEEVTAGDEEKIDGKPEVAGREAGVGAGLDPDGSSVTITTWGGALGA